MAVKTPHPDYLRFIDRWQRCRDVAEGQDAVHNASERYLPKLKDQEPADYAAYKARALFFNATWRTIAGMTGMMFRKMPRIVVPKAVEPLLEDVTLCELPLALFAMEAGIEVLTTGRVGILVDYPQANPAEVTQADAARLNLRPTMKLYHAESIVNWQLRAINNRAVIAQVRLKEEHTITLDEFNEKTETLYRVLDLDPSGYYRMRLYRSKDTGTGSASDTLVSDEQVGPEIYPTMSGSRMQFIPFYPIGVSGITWVCEEPPLIDLVDTNLSHYRVTADYEHGCHFTGLPTPYICGHTFPNKPNGQPGNERLYVGQSHAWVFPKSETKVGFLEFSGAGLEELRKNLEDKKQMMAVLGARMLEQQKRQVETAEVASLHRAGEESILGSIANALSMGFKAALQTYVDWAAADSTGVEFEINKQFYPLPMTPQELQALVAAWLSRAISKEVLFNNLQKGQIIPDEADFQDEEVKIENDAATAPLPPAPVLPPNDPAAQQSKQPPQGSA